MLDKSSKKIRLRVIAAYRTVSKPAVEVLSGLPPSELMAEYRRSSATAEDKDEANNRMMQEWRLRWDQTDTGRCTYRLIPYVRRWHERKHGMMDYHLMQAFTGHGCFSSYLHRFGKLAFPTCMFCEDPNDDAKHTLFECDAFHAQRRNIEMMAGSELIPENMMEVMLTSEANWDAIRTNTYNDDSETERGRGARATKTNIVVVKIKCTLNAQK